MEAGGEGDGPERESKIGFGVDGIFISALRVIFDIILVVFGEAEISAEV